MNKYIVSSFFLTMASIIFALTSCLTVDSYQDGITFSSANLYPEGIAYHRATDTIFVSSMKKGTVGTVTKDGTYATFIDDGYVSTSGVTVDNKRNRLFVAIVDPGVGEKTSPSTQKKVAAIAVYDIVNKNRLAYIDLAQLPGNANRPHFVNEIALALDGTVYATDSFSPIIYKISSNLQQAEIFFESALITGKGFAFNGLKLVNNDKTLLVLKSNTGDIFSVDVKNRALNKVSLPEGTNIIGADGFVLDDKIALVVFRNGKKEGIALLRFNQDFSLVSNVHMYTDTTIKELMFEGKKFQFFASTAFSFPTTIVKTPFGAYVLNASLGDAFSNKNRVKFNIIPILF